jgi:hypothetical protein
MSTLMWSRISTVIAADGIHPRARAAGCKSRSSHRSTTSTPSVREREGEKGGLMAVMPDFEFHKWYQRWHLRRGERRGE